MTWAVEEHCLKIFKNTNTLDEFSTLQNGTLLKQVS